MKKDPYLVLGLKRTASQEEKKLRWKQLRTKHHPDKGGDEAEFKRLKAAWEEIKDQPVHSTEQEKTFNWNSAHFTDGIFHHRRQSHFINIDAEISLTKAVRGGKYTLTIQLAHSSDVHAIEIEVPPGVQDGQTMTYPRLLLGNVDVNVTFLIEKDKTWSLEGINVIRKTEFSVWDLIKGCQQDVPTIYGTKVRVTIPPMTQPGTRLRLRSYGAVNQQNYLQKGDMFVEVQARFPADISPELLEAIKKYTN